MTLDYVQAGDEINATIVTAVAAVDTGILGYTLDTRFDGVPNSAIPDASKHWARVSIRTASTEQTAFCGDDPGPSAKQHTTRGVVIVELYSPLSIVGEDRKQQLLAKALLAALQNAETANGVWYRNARIRELADDGKARRRNIIAEFEYDTLHS